MRSVDEIVLAALEDGAFPGAQVVVRVGTEIVHARAYGALTPGGAAVTLDTHYDLASLTKPLSTALLVARAIAAGELSLGSPLRRFFGAAPDAVTVGHVLEHAAGFPAHRRFDREVEGPAGEPGVVAEILALAASTPLARPPGTLAEYSDIGFILLGAALEQVYGAPLSAAFRAIDPVLHFRDRRGPPSPPPPAGLSIAPTEGSLVGEVHDENARILGGAAGHAGLFGTATAVVELAARFLAALHGESDELVDPRAAAALVAPSAVPGSTRTFGWDRPSLTGSSLGDRFTRRAIGHLGFTGTSLWIAPEERIIVSFLTNRVHPTRENDKIKRVRPALHDAVWGELFGRGGPP